MNTPIYKLATSPDAPILINNTPSRVLPFLKNELSRLESETESGWVSFIFKPEPQSNGEGDL